MASGCAFMCCQPATRPLCQSLPKPLPASISNSTDREPRKAPAEHPPHATYKLISDLGENPSCSLWGKAQIGTRQVACSSLSSFYLKFTAEQSPSAPCSLMGPSHTEQLPVMLHLMALAFIQISFISCAHQAMLLSWTSVYRS